MELAFQLACVQRKSAKGKSIMHCRPLLWCGPRKKAITITGGSCHKYHFCRDKSFVATNTCLSRQNPSFAATKVSLSREKYFCRDKSFVATSILLSCQKTCFVATNTCFSRQKLMIFWQLPPMIDYCPKCDWIWFCPVTCPLPRLLSHKSADSCLAGWI